MEYAMAVKTPAPQRAAGRKKLAKEHKALPDGSFPIPNTDYLHKAIQAVGRAAPGKRPALAKLIRKRAKQLGSAGMAVLQGSWADSKQSPKEMANSLYKQLLECKYTPEQAALELKLTMPLLIVELASSDTKKKPWDPDNDNDDDDSASGDTDKDYAGSLSPKALAVFKKLKGKGWSDAKAMAFAKNADRGFNKKTEMSNTDEAVELATLGHWVGLGRGKGWKFVSSGGTSTPVSNTEKGAYDAHKAGGATHAEALSHVLSGRSEASVKAHNTASATAKATISAEHQKLLDARKAARAKYPAGHEERLKAERAVRQSRKAGKVGTPEANAPEPKTTTFGSHGKVPGTKEDIIQHLVREHGVSESMLRAGATRGDASGGANRSLVGLKGTWKAWHNAPGDTSDTTGLTSRMVKTAADLKSQGYDHAASELGRSVAHVRAGSIDKAHDKLISAQDELHSKTGDLAHPLQRQMERHRKDLDNPAISGNRVDEDAGKGRFEAPEHLHVSEKDMTPGADRMSNAERSAEYQRLTKSAEDPDAASKKTARSVSRDLVSGGHAKSRTESTNPRTSFTPGHTVNWSQSENAAHVGYRDNDWQNRSASAKVARNNKLGQYADTLRKAGYNPSVRSYGATGENYLHVPAKTPAVTKPDAASKPAKTEVAKDIKNLSKNQRTAYQALRNGNWSHAAAMARVKPTTDAQALSALSPHEKIVYAEAVRAGLDHAKALRQVRPQGLSRKRT
jgi:hypothetical protein